MLASIIDFVAYRSKLLGYLVGSNKFVLRAGVRADGIVVAFIVRLVTMMYIATVSCRCLSVKTEFLGLQTLSQLVVLDETSATRPDSLNYSARGHTFLAVSHLLAQ